VGLLAIEMFYNTDGSLWINELAPRPHNSGHHSINNGSVSQFENHLRAILGWPLGNTEALRPAIMINLLGEDGFSGPAQYEGLQDCLSKDGIHIHLYSKNETKPFRKMGHVTVTDQTMEACKEKATFVQHTLKVTA
jgi:5-(carboxyamino)imidazole ribonucleotide synthase